MSKYVGEVLKNNKGLKYKVLYTVPAKKNGTQYYGIEFLETGFKSTVCGREILTGLIKDRLHPIVHGVGAIGFATAAKNKRIYNIWNHMLGRCYNPLRKEYLSYGMKGVLVSKRWLRFDFFLKDFLKIDGYNEELFNQNLLELDKDKKQLHLPYNERAYSLETCTFLCPEENLSLRIFD